MQSREVKLKDLLESSTRGSGNPEPVSPATALEEGYPEFGASGRGKKAQCRGTCHSDAGRFSSSTPDLPWAFFIRLFYLD